MQETNLDMIAEQMLLESAFSLQTVVDKLLPKFFENDDKLINLIALLTKFAPNVLPKGLPALVERMRDPESSGLTKVILNSVYSMILVALLALVSAANGIEIVKNAFSRATSVFVLMGEIIKLTFKAVPNKIIIFMETLAAFDKAVKQNAFETFHGVVDTLVAALVNGVSAFDDAYKSPEFYENMSIVTKIKLTKRVVLLAKEGYFLGRIVSRVTKNVSSLEGLKSMAANLAGNISGKR